jgi:uncharacterized Zn finger protein
LPAADGIGTSKQRGAMASTWWSNRVVTLLESYGLGGRMQRGRRYARLGQLVRFDVLPGQVIAQVQGSRPQPYHVSVATRPLTDRQWGQVEDAMRARVAFAARLLAGEVPSELEEVFDTAGVALLPRTWRDVQAACTCPDWGDPCKHVAAVLYVLADRLDDDPWLLLQWRGRGRDELLAHLRPSVARPSTPPWWPLVPGRGVPEPARADELGLVEAPDEPIAALRRCEPLAVEVRGVALTDLLGPAYLAFVDEEKREGEAPAGRS